MKGRGAQILILILVLLVCLFCVLPVLLVFMTSFSSEQAVQQYGYSFWPKEFSLAAYRLVFSNGSMVFSSYRVSIIVTLVGTLGALLITYMAGYTLAAPHVRYRNVLSMVFFIPMVFSAGMVPWYMVNTLLGLKNNYLALIVPSLLFSSYNMFLTRNFLRGVPEALMESAKVDGANDITVAFRIYFPLATPVLATITLFYGVAYWNDYWNSIMLINSRVYYPLQFLLYKLKSDIQMMKDVSNMGVITGSMPSDTFKMATCVLTMGPILLLYPYLQRYFIKGLVIGSVKG